MRRTFRGLRPTAIAVAVAVLTTLAVNLPDRADAGASSLPDGFTSTPVFTGLTLPTSVAFSPDGKVYVAEKSGVVKVFASVSSNNGAVFKDLSQRVYNFNDRGLLGLTVDPRLGQGTGHDFVYVLYTKDSPPGRTPPVWNDNCPHPPGSDTDGCVVTGTLSRIPVLPNGTAGAEQVLIDEEWCQQFSSHSIGDLRFGADGYLYVTGGEGASWTNADWGQWGGSLPNTPTPKNPCGDPANRGGAMRSQSPRRPVGERRELGGALLRVDPATGAGVPGNPMYSASSPSSNASRIVAYGMRNPYRFTTRPGTGEVWIGDVGWGTYEEVNRVPTPTPSTAINFGWPCLEEDMGVGGYNALAMCKALYDDDTAVLPYLHYEHGEKASPQDTCGNDDGSSVSGLAFYEGTNYPSSYANALFVADASRNCIYVVSVGPDGLPKPSTIRTFMDDSDNPYPVKLETEPMSKDIFYVNIGFGTVNRISYATSNRAPTAHAAASPTSGPAPLSVQLDASGSSDPDGDALTYSWDVDGNGTFGDVTGKKPAVTYPDGGSYVARVMVTDPGGLSSTSTGVTITVTNPAGPSNTAPPLVSGSAQVGGTLTSTTGAWNGVAPITYARQWQRCTSGGSCSDIAGATTATYVPQLADEGRTIRVRATASNSGGSSSKSSDAVGPVTGAAANTPPVPIIETPTTAARWKAGDLVSFSGRATDAEDGNVPAAKLSWTIVMGHCPPSGGCHEHPVAERIGVASGTVAGADHEAPSFLQFTLTATDAAGATATAVRRVDPHTVDLTFLTDPEGLSLAVGSGQDRTGPFTQSWVVNSLVQMSAPTQQTVGSKLYSFEGWSDGGHATHVIHAPEHDTTYTAAYRRQPKPEPGGSLVGIMPNRVLDTRRASEGPCVAGTREIVVAPSDGVPAEASAVAMNVTVTGARAAGYLTVYPSGSARPMASNLNYGPGATVPNLVTTKVGTNGRLSIYASGGCPHVVVDVTGYYTDGTTRAGGFVGLTPTRALDTRQGGAKACVSSAGRRLAVAPHAAAGVPADAEAVALNVTVVGSTSAGYLTVYPSGSARPTASNLNYATRQTIANHVTAKVGANGEITIYSSGGCPHVVVDIAGYFAGGDAGPGAFVGITPNRVLDTRQTGQGPCVTGERELRVAPSTGVPADADAVVLNVTSVDAKAPGYLTVYPDGSTRPTASNVNYAKGTPVPNAVVTGVRNGKIRVFASGGCPHVVVDVVGYHRATPLS